MVTVHSLDITQMSSKSMYAYDFPTQDCILILVIKNDVPFRNVQASITFDFHNKVCTGFRADGMSVHLRA